MAKGRKRKLRAQLKAAEEAAAREAGSDAGSVSEDGGSMDAPPTGLPPGVGPSMEEMMGGGGKMKASLMHQMRDEEEIARAIEGKGEARRKKRKPWWERKNWWVGKVPQKSGNGDDEQVEAVAYYPPVDLATRFATLPDIHKSLLKSLQKEGFSSMTEIQRRCVPELLRRRDVLGQAKTGSGKTLAFSVPLLSDLLYANAAPGHTSAIVISPTKELCHQICTVMQRLLANVETNVTAELITGGTKVKAEANRLKQGISVVVATPGRLLDHMRHTKQWKWKKMVEWLVIDEADRVLMEGFQRELDAILQFLQDCPNRTTALFSATMARGMQDLGRLSFYEPPMHITDITFHHDPEEIEEHRQRMQNAIQEAGEEEEEEEEEAEEYSGDEGQPKKRQKTSMASKDIARLKDEGGFNAPVPSKERLRQVAMVCEVQDKLVHLYKVLRELTAKGAKKIIVFFASCASAQFHNMMLNTILNGDLQCLMLHGKMKHRQRVATFDFFCQEEDGVLFCTDVVARGLDIPDVEYVYFLFWSQTSTLYTKSCMSSTEMRFSTFQLLFFVQISGSRKHRSPDIFGSDFWSSIVNCIMINININPTNPPQMDRAVRPPNRP